MKKSAKFEPNHAIDNPIESSSLSSGTKKSAKLASLEAFLFNDNLHGVKNGVSFKNYRSAIMAKRQLKLFKDPKIIRCTNGDWYVEYKFRNPDDLTKWKTFKERSGINYIKDLTIKEQEAETLRMDVFQWLMAGNSPFSAEEEIKEKIVAVTDRVEKIRNKTNVWSLQKAIQEYEKFVAGNGHAETTLRTYRKYIRLFKEWAIKNDLLNEKACLFTEMDCQVYLDEMFEENDWSGRTFNNYLEFMVTFFTKCRKLEKTATKNRDLKYDFNPDDLQTKISVPQRNKAFTPVLFEKLKTEAEKPGFEDLRDYLEWITLSFMRPAEIRELKIEYIDHINRQIRFKGKTGDRIVPISDQLLNLINRRHLLENNLKSFVFGYAGKVDERRMSAAYFLNKFEIIAKKLKLDENYGPYSCKPTGVIMMIKAGFTDKQIMEVTGHKTESAFSAYKRDLVLENGEVMKGSTINF